MSVCLCVCARACVPACVRVYARVRVFVWMEAGRRGWKRVGGGGGEGGGGQESGTFTDIQNKTKEKQVAEAHITRD